MMKFSALCMGSSWWGMTIRDVVAPGGSRDGRGEGEGLRSCAPEAPRAWEMASNATWKEYRIHLSAYSGHELRVAACCNATKPIPSIRT
jgi:hypothetical protein